MTEAQKQALIEKLARWRGFTEHWGSWFFARYKETNHWWESPTGRKFYRLPNFPDRLDACAEHLWPKLTQMSIQVQLSTPGEVFLWDLLTPGKDREDDLPILACWVDRDNLATAFCLALEKYVDSVGK